MTRANPNKKRCARKGCNAWSQRGSELCSSHNGLVGGGAPKGNRNGWKHGYYASPQALGFDEDAGKGRTIDETIALLAARRNGLDRWLTERMAAGEDLDYLTFLQLISRTTWKIARLLKFRELNRSATDRLADLFEGLPDDESDELGPGA